MAEERAHDVVDQLQSVGDLSPSDAPAATSTTDLDISGEDVGGVEDALKENGIHTTIFVKMDDLEEASGRSDTDTSRADGSVAGDKTNEPKPLKKFSTKPVSFAKYSVPKVVAANATAKGTDKVSMPNSSTSSLQQIGRPRLVAKPTSAIQQKPKPYKNAAPDPMQVWNKNRVTPQPSTKHLTDEELKQQYGIHLTSRLQDDGDGKEAKWADIDDDEDDWAPETIEWNDGTKSTLNTTEIMSPTTQKLKAENLVQEAGKEKQPPKILAPQFSSTVGPNAMVLKIGASAERQQAQKTIVQQPKGATDKSTSATSRTGLAPNPAKSPWATLPPVDKVSPVVINPPLQVSSMIRYPPMQAYPQNPSSMNAPSPAKEISADDFNRTWREHVPGQPRELYMPNSGRYEAVPEGRRRMSKNDQNFRAPAVLQRPGQVESHSPAEPSAAFQTNRTSTDQARRRASSNISGGSGQFARRMQMRPGEGQAPVFDLQTNSADEIVPLNSQEDHVQSVQTPTYQAQGPNADYMSSGDAADSQVDLETQRTQQRALMKENIERARRRKIEEEERLEAEKQERIKLKLASLGLDLKADKVKVEEQVSSKENEASIESPGGRSTSQNQSPPKPPQPLASGEPQQYGMMKVHPLDTVKKMSPPNFQVTETSKPMMSTTSENSMRKESGIDQIDTSPILNGVRSISEHQAQSVQDQSSLSESSPKLSKNLSVGADARSGWGDVRNDHRSPPSGNLWGLPNNKALGNGTFDQSLAGYAPQDLSRTTSSAQGWLNGKTPTAGRSPQPQYANGQVSEPRTQLHPTAKSPDQQPLAVDSEADSLFPITRPAPIAPPQQNALPMMNGHPIGPQTNGNLAAWNNFHHLASQQERAESEKLQRELAAKREEETRTGVRQGPHYTFSETWKQVQLGEHAGQRHVSNVAQTSIPPSTTFGAVGSLSGTEVPQRAVNGQNGRGSRFFPPSTNGYPSPDRRAVTFSHIELPRTPSPPPAEDNDSLHPAFEGSLHKPVVHFPREKAVVKLPPAMPPTPPSPVQAEVASLQPETPLTWAARVSLPARMLTPPLRAVSTPITQNPSWQERFNGLLGKKTSPVRQAAQPVTPSPAVASSTRELLDVLPPAMSAAVSLPLQIYVDPLEDAGLITSKDVEHEEDLFEDRELASLPAINFPRESLSLLQPRAALPHAIAEAPVSTSASFFMVNNLFDRPPSKPQFAIVRLPGSTRSVKKDIPMKSGFGLNSAPKLRNSSASYPNKSMRNRGGSKLRQPSKSH